MSADRYDGTVSVRRESEGRATPVPAPSGTADLARSAWSLIRAIVDSPEVVAAEHAFMQSVELPIGPVRTLRALLELGPQPMSRLAEAMGCDRSYVTGTVKALQTHGLARTEIHPTDRRSKVVALTEKGRRVARRARAVHRAAPTSFSALDAAELDELVALLNRINDTDRRWDGPVN